MLELPGDQTTPHCWAQWNNKHGPEGTLSELVENREGQGNGLDIFQKAIYGCFSEAGPAATTMTEELCLWLPGPLFEVELVICILNNFNPRVERCLRVTVTTVEQLVKVGSVVEKQCICSHYWQKSQHSAKKRPRNLQSITSTKIWLE